MDDGTVKLLISYEDETGEATTMEKEISLFVSEPYFDDMMMDEGMMPENAEQGGGGGPLRTALIVIGILLLIVLAAVIIILRRKKKKEQKSLENDIYDILDLDREGENKDDEIF